ncbi:GntR family transcriptional regulator [Rhizobium sp. ICMP 5592]|uniref:GntR family transcriptional regulator n=1 Tax=Rhizobium sp. ICMP 5592 TaxID=2292445 RepID=UPI001294F2DD|nr:GntR family transcriptional regulator [Rhizobium sp. ICMP 5592]MQB44748.1 GntR family transcriptional regulator [Rhizobium sp. ICMP 5592]
MFDTQSPFLPTGMPDAVSIAEDRLRHAIISGALAPGERLSEIEICKDYGVGRGIVRAALARLAHAGFVSSQPRSGWKVTPITAIGLREVILGRRQLEPLLADVELPPEEFRRLETLCDMHAALAAAHAAGLDEQIVLARRYERQLKHLLATHMRAPLIAGWLENLWDKSECYVGFLEAKGSQKLPLADWGAFVDAKRSGRGQAARECLAEICETFARFAQARFLEADVVAVEVPSKRVRAPAADLPATALFKGEVNPKRAS